VSGRRKQTSARMIDSVSQAPGDIQDTILRVLERNRLAVLATQRDGQPHASLMAFTPLGGLRFLAFATYRETLKYKSIGQDPRVAILVEDREGDLRCSGQPLVLTALGEAIETPEEERHAHIAKHLTRQPGLQNFLCSSECEFIRVAVNAYQVVGGIDDVQWFDVGESAAI
jgi:nitroimidazol reductase NimA-like FMN-containing flavoprotein (pyridoxamine 5'-phosphate oxidase superfamily)